MVFLLTAVHPVAVLYKENGPKAACDTEILHFAEVSHKKKQITLVSITLKGNFGIF